MENRSFKLTHQKYLEAYKMLSDLNAIKELRGVSLIKHVKRIEKVKRAVKFYEEKLKQFGQGTLIQVSGDIAVPVKKGSTLTALRPFSMYLINVSIEDAQEYFKTIVKNKYSNVLEKTISFKAIPIGILKTN